MRKLSFFPFKKNDLHRHSAFVPKPNHSPGAYVDPWADAAVLLPPQHSAMRPPEQLSVVNDNPPPPWDETDDPLSFSTFVHENNSVQVVDPQSNEEALGFGHSDLAHEQDQTNNGSSINITAGLTGGPTVKQLWLRQALTVAETTTVYEACCQMAAESADALVITDSNALVVGILTYKDTVTKAIAHKLDLVNTTVSTVMTKNPTSMSSDTLPVEALLKMNKENVNQLPVVENGKVIGIVKQLDYLGEVAVGLTVAEGYDYKVALADALEKNWKMSNYF